MKQLLVTGFIALALVLSACAGPGGPNGSSRVQPPAPEIEGA